jgi:hypothetical protein
MTTITRKKTQLASMRKRWCESAALKSAIATSVIGPGSIVALVLVYLVTNFSLGR